MALDPNEYITMGPSAFRDTGTGLQQALYSKKKKGKIVASPDNDRVVEATIVAISADQKQTPKKAFLLSCSKECESFFCIFFP